MRCKPNEMAFITAGPNSGALVECIRFIGAFDEKDARDYWEVRALSHVTGRSSVGSKRHEPGFIGVCRDSAMRPLRGDPSSMNTTKEQPIAA